jgi:hypothetical protein
LRELVLKLIDVTKVVQAPTSHLESKAKGEEGERKEEKRGKRKEKLYS